MDSVRSILAHLDTLERRAASVADDVERARAAYSAACAASAAAAEHEARATESFIESERLADVARAKLQRAEKLASEHAANVERARADALQAIRALDDVDERGTYEDDDSLRMERMSNPDARADVMGWRDEQ